MLSHSAHRFSDAAGASQSPRRGCRNRGVMVEQFSLRLARGMIAIVAELIILAALLVRQKRSLRTAIGIGVFLAIVVGLLVWIGGSELSKRIQPPARDTLNFPATFALTSTATAFACS